MAGELAMQPCPPEFAGIKYRNIGKFAKYISFFLVNEDQEMLLLCMVVNQAVCMVMIHNNGLPCYV
jgi:hypothetical protein